MIRASLVLIAILLLSGCGGSSDAEQPLQVAVTNDDGVKAAGIAAMVDRLRQDPHLTVSVFAPETNRSGTGDTITKSGTITVQPAMTASGVTATSVRGTPADSILFALTVALPEPPDLVVSGINDGQNIGELVYGPGLINSGTVGAALWAARNGVPAIAVSQGSGATSVAEAADYVAGLVDRFRSDRSFHDQLLAGNVTGQAIVLNVNFPTCASGGTRGVRVVPLGRSSRLTGYALSSESGDTKTYTPQVETTNLFNSDCTSTLANPATDVEAMNNGFASVTPLSTDVTLAGGLDRFRSLER